MEDGLGCNRMERRRGNDEFLIYFAVCFVCRRPNKLDGIDEGVRRYCTRCGYIICK